MVSSAPLGLHFSISRGFPLTRFTWILVNQFSLILDIFDFPIERGAVSLDTGQNGGFHNAVNGNRMVASRLLTFFLTLPQEANSLDPVSHNTASINRISSTECTSPDSNPDPFTSPDFNINPDPFLIPRLPDSNPDPFKIPRLIPFLIHSPRMTLIGSPRLILILIFYLA